MNLIKFSKFYKFFISIIIIIDQVTKANDMINNDTELGSTTTPTAADTTDFHGVSYILTNNGELNTNTHPHCDIPSYLNSAYKILNQPEAIYQPGDYVTEYSILEITCDEGYKLPSFAQSTVVCINNQWNNPPQACLRTCPSLMSTPSTTVKCTYNGSTTSGNCINPVDGTMVHLTCNPFYEIDAAVKRNSIRTCRNGTWIPNLPQCYATCGLRNNLGTYRTPNGEIATPGNHPWHVGVYTNTTEFLCSGTLIDQNIVISAAHCFADFFGNLLPVENFLIAAGKFYRDYDHDWDTFAQYSKVRTIFIPPKYENIDGFYSNDVAVLILEDFFKLTPGVLPACIDLNEESKYMENSFNSNGIVSRPNELNVRESL